MTMTHLPGAAPAGPPGAGSPQGPGNRKGGLRIAGVTIRLTIGGAGLDGGRIVRAVSWARSGGPIRAGLDGAVAGVLTPADFARAAQLGALHLRTLHLGTLHLGQPAR